MGNRMRTNSHKLKAHAASQPSLLSHTDILTAATIYAHLVGCLPGAPPGLCLFLLVGLCDVAEIQ